MKLFDSILVTAELLKQIVSPSNLKLIYQLSCNIQILCYNFNIILASPLWTESISSNHLLCSWSRSNSSFASWDCSNSVTCAGFHFEFSFIFHHFRCSKSSIGLVVNFSQNSCTCCYFDLFLIKCDCTYGHLEWWILSITSSLTFPRSIRGITIYGSYSFIKYIY